VPAEEDFSFGPERTQIIAGGAQQQIYGEAPLIVLDRIVEQHRQYGIVEASDLIRFKGFARLVYSFDEPVPLDKLHYGVDHNQGALFDLALQQRQEGAAAFSLAVEQNLMEAQHNGAIRGSAELRSVSVETLEDSDNPKFGEGIKIDRLVPRELRSRTG